MASFPVTGGTDNLKGTAAGDDFVVSTSADLQNTDKIDGKAGTDILKFTSGGGVVDAQFTGVKSVETVEASGSFAVKLGAFAANAGVNLVNGIAVTDTLKVDAADFTNASGITVIGATGGTDNVFTGSQFDDRFTVTATSITGSSNLDGGDGIDTLTFSAASAFITNNMFFNVHNFEVLAASGANQSFEFANFASDAGLNIVDGTNASGTLGVDASGHNGGVTLRGINKDTTVNFTGAGLADLLVVQSTNTAQNTFDGAGAADDATFGDVLQYVGDGKIAFKVEDAQLANLTDIETLRVSGAPIATVNLGAQSGDAGIKLVDGAAISGTLNVDASQRLDPITILSGSGVNNLKGTIDSDTFNFTSKGLLATDIVDGGGIGDNDRIEITDKAAIVDAAFTKVTHVEELAFTQSSGPVSDYTGAKVVLGAKSVTSGITTVTNETDYGLTVDASARGTTATVFNGGFADDTFVASTGLTAADTFNAGAGNDSLRIKLAAFTEDDAFNGGDGIDEIRILDALNTKDPATKIVDGDFDGIQNVERLVFDATGAQDVTLASNALDFGLRVVDGSKVTGGLTLDATKFASGLEVFLGTGKDTYLAGSSDSDVFVQSTKLNGDDTVDAGGGTLIFTDAVKIADTYFKAISGGKITNVNEIVLDNGAAGQTFVAGTNFEAFTVASGVSVISATGGSSSSYTFDFSAYKGDKGGVNIDVSGGDGNDVFIGGAGPAANTYNGDEGDDSFRFASANLAVFGGIDGGDGTDELVVLDAGANPGPFKIADSFFDALSSIETLRLGAAKTGSYEVTLDAKALGEGISRVDASLAGVNVKINAANLKSDTTYLLGAKDNTISGGDKSGVSNTFIVDAKTVTSGDIIDGGDGFSTLRFSTGGAISADSLKNFDSIERVELSDAGNSIVLNGNMLGSIIVAPVPLSDGTPSVFAFFSVIGGKGSDTVDLSQMGGGGAVLAGGGTDTFIGSAGFDQFIFEHQADLTSADKVDGGDGDIDTVIGGAGTWSSDAFKGFKNIEQFSIFDADFSKDSTVVLKDAFFASSVTADADGIRSFTVAIDERMESDDTLDASLVTSGMSSVVFSFAAQNGDKAFAIDENDTVVGGAGWDAIELANLNLKGSLTLNDIAFAGVSRVEALRISSDATGGTTLHLGASMEAAGIQMVDASEADKNLIMDVAGFKDGIKVLLGDNDDDVTLGSGDDTVTFSDGAFLDANDKIDGNGGNGNERIEFLDGQVIAGAFKDVHDIDVVALKGSADAIVIDADVIAANVSKVDASQAQQGVVITNSGGAVGLTILGSSFGDKITGTSAADTIWGGLGHDILKGNGGADTYVYTSITESRQGPAGDTSHMDFISDFNAANDKFDFRSVLGNTAVLGTAATPGAFTQVDDPDFFKDAGGTVVAQFDANFDLTLVGGVGTGGTRIYVDANQNGNLDLAEDIVVMVAGDQTVGLDVDEFTGLVIDPLRPVLEESNAKVLPAAKTTYTDADVAGDNDALVLTATKGDYKITLGEPATNGFRFIDGSVVTGVLTVDAAKHFDPVYIASGKGKNDLTGTAGDDVFYFTGAGLTGDKVNGGPVSAGLESDHDAIFITDKSSLVDTAFSGVKNVEILEFGPNPIPGQLQVDVTGQKVVLGAKSEAAGITTVINDWVAGLTVDASARKSMQFDGGAGNDVLIGSASDDFNGGGGDDSYRVKLANFDSDDFNGGVGTDEVRILDSWDGKTTALEVVDSDFDDFTSVERLVFDGTGKQKVTLDGDAGEAGIKLVDGSKVSGGLDVTIGNNIDHAVTVIAGTGKDKITLGADGGDILIASTKLTKDDVLDGGGDGFLHFTDAVKLTDAYFGGIKDIVTNFIGTELDLDNDAKGQSLVAGVNYADFVNNSGMNSVVANTTQGFTADFTNYLATGGVGNTTLLTFIGGEGNDVVTVDKNGLVSVIAQGGDDTVKVSSAALLAKAIVVNGGDGSDKLVILDADTFGDARFDNVAETEILVLGASKTGAYVLSALDSEFLASGIRTIDGSLAGVNVDIDGTLLAVDLTMIAGSKVNFLSGGDGNDTMVYDTKTFDGADDATGGDSGSGDTLKFSTGGVINTTAFTNGFVFDIEKIAFSDAGNTLVVTDAVIGQVNETDSDLAVLELPGGETRTFELLVQGGKGNDTVDFSAIGENSILAIVGNGGADKFTGSAGSDTFIFPLAGDLTSADTVKGGAGGDTLMILAGTYKVDAFKGVSSVEFIQVIDPTGASDASIALNSDFFKGIDLDGEGHRVATVAFDQDTTGRSVVDGSAVTDATASIHVNFGAGFDTFIGGAGSDVVHFGDDGTDFLLDLEDTVNGGLGWDAIQLEFGTSDLTFDGSAFAHVKNVEELDLIDDTGGNGNVDVVLDGDAEESGLQLVDASDVGGDLDLDLSGGFNTSLTVKAGGGTADFIRLGDGDDVVWYQNDISLLDKTDVAIGGNGQNTLRFSGDTTLVDDQFTNANDFQTLELRDGTFDVTLGTKAGTVAAIETVDASKAGLNGGLDLHAATYGAGLEVIGSVAVDTIETGDDHDLIRGGSSGDSLTGNLGADTFSYSSNADSFLISSANQTHVDTIQDFSFAVDGDAIDLSAFDLVATTGVATDTLANTVNNFSANIFNGRTVLVLQDGADCYVFADTNKNGTYEFNGDLVIKVVGATASDVEDGISFSM